MAAAGATSGCVVTAAGRVITWGTTVLSSTREDVRRPTTEPFKQLHTGTRAKRSLVHTHTRQHTMHHREPTLVCFDDAEDDAQRHSRLEYCRAFGQRAPSTPPKTLMLACGGDHILATREDGTLWSWGSNAQGQLGHGDSAPRTSPTRLDAFGSRTEVLTAAAGGQHSLALVRGGGLPSPRVVQAWQEAECWGFLQLHFPQHCAHSAGPSAHRHGADTEVQAPIVTRSSPGSVMRKTVNDVVKARLASAAASSISLVDAWPDPTTRIWSWGAGHEGALGLGDTLSRCTPALVDSVFAGGDQALQVGCGKSHTLVVTEDGRLFSCGRGSEGQLGHDSVQSCPCLALVSVSFSSLCGRYSCFHSPGDVRGLSKEYLSISL